MATLDDATEAITAYRNLLEPLSGTHPVARVDRSKVVAELVAKGAREDEALDLIADALPGLGGRDASHLYRSPALGPVGPRPTWIHALEIPADRVRQEPGSAGRE
jgi:hypothetical protein